MQKITLIGAGLAGSLLAIFLAKRGFLVEVFEKRPDMRKVPIPAGRSINLALSSRGIKALEKIGIAQEILEKEAIPMYGRMLHDLEGNLHFMPYSQNPREYINSVSRWGLNVRLLNLAEKFENINIYFEHEFIDFEPSTQTATFTIGTQKQLLQQKVERIIAADGAGSQARQVLAKYIPFEENIDFLEHGYKELNIPPLPNGNFAIEKNALHIWPRGTYMLIALPNLDGSFTCTLFFPNKGEFSFESIDTEHKVLDFFSTYFKDTIQLIPNLVKEFLYNPLGILGTVKCFPWNYQDKLLLLGDAAHAIVPFYGQGMNASFEDCLYLDMLIEKYANDWHTIFEKFTQDRKPNTDAIADLALENFYEMRDHVANPLFQKMRKVELLLEKQYPNYYSKYAMVSFHPEIPYSEAKTRGNWQNELLAQICESITDINEVNLSEIYAKMLQYQPKK
ncbi:MAG: FAD-dependent monooxygenase [Microscillaceae bacterium]|nr:FAD-dependent monooxygenase [Microscillaceae bacterium]MDW8460948.1 NAD(P)/FAD-dependent oxidoreductase [Cytophagales bacterium]